MKRVVSIVLAATALSCACAGKYLKGIEDSEVGLTFELDAESQMYEDLEMDASCSTEGSGSDYIHSADVSEASDGGYWDVLCSNEGPGSDYIHSAYASEASDGGYWEVLCSNEASGSDYTDTSYLIEASGSDYTDTSYLIEASGSDYTDTSYLIDSSGSDYTDTSYLFEADKLYLTEASESDYIDASSSTEPYDSDFFDVSCSTEASGSGYSSMTLCPTDSEPVCGSDGVTYVNACAYSIAQCRTATLSLLSFGECAKGSEASSDESSTSESKTESCHFACLDIYDPVSDESGKTYSNECYMRRAKCKNTNEDVDILAEYKRLYGRSFGAPRDDSAMNDSSNEENAVESLTESDNSHQSTESSEVPTSSLGGTGDLYKGDFESGSGSSSSITCASCPDLYSPVCGSDGTTYLSLCELELARCKNPKLELVQTSEDFCADSSPEQVVLDDTSTSLDSATS